MQKILIIVCALLLSVGCASVHSGNMAKDEKGKALQKGGMSVSGLENTSLASKHFLALDVTIENNTDTWIVIETASISFVNDDITSKMTVPVGRDLLAWSEAAQRNAAISSYNTNLVLGGIAAAGAVGALSSGSKTSTASAIALAGAGSAIAASSFNDKLNSIERAKVLPENHLYSGNFSVPPGLHAKRWVTFYVAEPYKIPFLKEMTVQLKVKGGENYSFKIPFRRSVAISDFQNLHPDNRRYEQK